MILGQRHAEQLATDGALLRVPCVDCPWSQREVVAPGRQEVVDVAAEHLARIDLEAREANGQVRDEWGSRIALESSQPGVHPPPRMPVPRWWWVCDAEPWSRPHATKDAVPEEPPPQLPDADEPLSFEAHIRSLFRERDRNSMRFAFDLWSHDGVATHADAILERLRAGTMPCDGPWPPERIGVFERWVSTGKHA